MRFYGSSQLILVLTLGVLSVSTFAKSITLFPPSHALISQKGQTQVLGGGQSAIRPLPSGIILPYFSVVSPADGIPTLTGWWSRDASDSTLPMQNRSVIVNGQTGILIAQTPELWVIQHPDRLATYPKTTPIQAPDVVALRSVALNVPAGTPVEWTAVVDTLPSTMLYALQMDGTQSRLKAMIQVQNNTLVNLENMPLDVKVGGQLFEESAPATQFRVLQSAKFDAGTSQSADVNQYYYTVPTPVSLSAGQTVQIPLFESLKLKPQPIFRLESRRVNPDGSTTQLQRLLTAKNTTGYPLAAGPIQLIVDGKLVAIGNLVSTGLDAEFRIPFGTSLDVTGTRKLVSTSLADRTRTETVEFNVVNASSKVAVVEVVESTWGNAEVIRASQGYRRMGSDVVFDVRLGPKAAQSISVTIRYPQ